MSIFDNTISSENGCDFVSIANVEVDVVRIFHLAPNDVARYTSILNVTRLMKLVVIWFLIWQKDPLLSCKQYVCLYWQYFSKVWIISDMSPFFPSLSSDYKFSSQYCPSFRYENWFLWRIICQFSRHYASFIKLQLVFHWRQIFILRHTDASTQ